MNDIYLGYYISAGKKRQVQRLEGKAALVTFLKGHLYEDEVLITDSGDNLIFRSIDGVDLYSQLNQMGIDLPSIYQEIHALLYAVESNIERESWEDLYDSIGLSAGEIRMRKRVKAACRAAKTVTDVARLLDGTYFDAIFHDQGRTQTWRHFNPQDNSVVAYRDPNQVGEDKEQERTVHLDPDTRVKHIYSSEDIHHFMLLVPPGE